MTEGAAHVMDPFGIDEEEQAVPPPNPGGPCSVR
jgi:hypothetical protein